MCPRRRSWPARRRPLRTPPPEGQRHRSRRTGRHLRAIGREHGAQRRAARFEEAARSDADPEHQNAERQQGQDFARVEILERPVLVLGDRSPDRLLEHLQQVDRGEHDAEGGDPCRPEKSALPGADEDHELADEAVERRQADRGQGGEDEHDGEPGDRLRETAELLELLGVAAVIEHPDEQEEGAGRETVVDHLEQGALPGDLVEGEEAEHDESEVGDRGVGDQLLHVDLGPGDQRAVDDADQRQADDPGRELGRGLREERDREAQEAVGAELEQDAGQDHRAAGGGLDVGVGQPGVEREHRHLDRERQGEGAEQPELLARAGTAAAADPRSGSSRRR